MCGLINNHIVLFPLKRSCVIPGEKDILTEGGDIIKGGNSMSAGMKTDEIEGAYQMVCIVQP